MAVAFRKPAYLSTSVGTFKSNLGWLIVLYILEAHGQPAISWRYYYAELGDRVCFASVVLAWAKHLLDVHVAWGIEIRCRRYVS